MTAVVAYTNGKNVWIAADSYIGNDQVKDTCRAPKVYKVGPLAVGICGSVRQELILESFLKSIDPKIINENWLRFTFPDQFEELTKNKNAVVENRSQSTLGECSYLFGLHGKIYYLDDDFGIWEPRRNISSIGIGKEYCLGGLSVISKKELETNPKLCLIKVLKATSEWCPYVLKPFFCITV